MSDTSDSNTHAAGMPVDSIAIYDHMRHLDRIVYSDRLHYAVLHHADVMRIVLDPATFSNRVSRHPAVPNGMDGPQHTAYRRAIAPFFDADHMTRFKPVCQAICHELIASLPHDTDTEIMFGLAHPFAVRMQCAFLGWPDALHEPLLHWVHKKDQAIREGNRHGLATVAAEFDDTIRALLRTRRNAGRKAPDDITTALLRQTVNGKPMQTGAIVSILRNWTVGELGSIAASVGIITQYLATHRQLQQHLRQQPALVRAANDEILRMRAPLVANQRTPTCPVRIGHRYIELGERLTLMWASANRDEAVFGDPDKFRLDRDPRLNLLYGAGIHACPGAPLARLELETIVRTLLAVTRELETASGAPSIPATYPAGGYRFVNIYLRTVNRHTGVTHASGQD